ncbi:MAG: MFS transporter [Selenomonadaceae bacterium]|nr:MFS transporter [Selenomonadaceae bacterium]
MTKKFPFHYGYIVAACCTLIVMFSTGIVINCSGIFFVAISEELGVPVSQIAMYLSFNLLASSIMLAFAGGLMEKFGARLTMTLSAIILGATLISMSKFDALWEFYLAGAILGIALTFLMYLGFPTIIPRWFNKKVGLMIGIAAAGSSIGGAIFNPICGMLINSYGWRMTYIILGAAILILIAPISGIFLRNKPADVGLKPYGESKISARQNKNDGYEYRAVLKMPMFYGLFMFGFLMSTVASVFHFVPKYMATLNFSLEEAATVASAAMIGSMTGKVGLGWINDKSLTAGVITTIGLGIFGLGLMISASSLNILIGGGFLFGWALAGVFVQTPLLVRAVFGNKSYSQIYSNISIGLTVSAAIAMAAWGYLAEFGGYSSVFIFAIVLLGICGAIGLRALQAAR